MKKNKFGFVKSDCRLMTLQDKGEILFMHKQGFGVKAIASAVDRSMDWVGNIIGALTGCDIESELIKLWEDKKDGKGNRRQSRDDGNSTRKPRAKRTTRKTSKRKDGTRSVSGFSKALRVESDYQGISTRNSKRYNVNNRQSGNLGGRSSRVSDNSKSGSIITTLRKNKDYVGE